MPFNMELRECYIFKQIFIIYFHSISILSEFILALEGKLISVNN